ncbi:MAG: Amuc_1098 family type IV pilus outer membrane protein [Chthoniobacterales bacterium]
MMKNFPLPVGISPVSASAGVGLLFALSLGLPSVAAQNQSPTTSPLAAESERAIVRSQENLTRARSLMHDALGKKAENNLEGAYRDASEALELTPSGDAVKSARAGLVGDYTTIALAYARELIRNGRYQDAESVAKSVLDPSVNPSNREAVGLLSDLEQPEHFNKTVTPKSAAQRDQVVKLLREAEQLGQSGRNELALSRYDQVLQIDPYNNAARKGMQEINLTKMKYADEAYNETRSRMLWQVEKAWERPPRKTKQGRSTESVGRQQDIRGTEQIVAKMNSIIIPKIDLSDSPISEAVEYLKQKSVEQDPAKKGVNIFLKLGAPTPAPAASPGTTEGMAASSSTPSGAGEPHVSLILNQVPLYVALDYLCKLSNLKLKIDPYAVSIVPLSEPTDILVTKEYQVPPTFIPPKPLNAGGGIPQAGGGVSDPNTPRVAGRYNAQEYLLSQGVDFPPGASANYLPSGSKLVVRNTRDNIDVIDALVDAAMGVAPSQVDIQTKFLEINQNNLQELGFSWLLGPFSIGGGVYGSGGGNAAAVNSANYPFGNPMAGGYPMSPVGSVRSGDQAITGNSVDSLLAGKTGISDATAPGIFSIAGVFTDPQFQLVIRALNQKKGIDLMSAPKVTTKSGVKATVKIVNEFIYPRQYDPPLIPQSTQTQIQGTTSGTVDLSTQPPPTVTPSFPRDFTKQDLGVVLEATPKIGPDGYTIDLELNPRVTDFDGFINYGSPINAVGYTRDLANPAIKVPILQTLTTNTINQPVFSVREVNTFVTVWDGQTVALGGLIREDVQKVQDKVPFLGDIPLAGRLFRSDTDQKLKKNLVIFVTPRILDAEGQPRRGDMEEPEIVKPLGLPEDLPQPSVTTPAVRTK